MRYSAYFAERAEHYRKLAKMTTNGRQTECQLGLANLFLEMSCDMRLRELAVAPTVQRDQNAYPNRKALEDSMRHFFGRTAEATFDIRVEHLG